MSLATPRRSTTTPPAWANSGVPLAQVPQEQLTCPQLPCRSLGRDSRGPHPLPVAWAIASRHWSTRSRPRPRQARSQMRSRLWGAPASEARLTTHRASYPASARSERTTPKSLPPLEERAPRTFSHQMSGAWHLRATLTWSRQRTDLVPLKPARFPAVDTSWQGLPPTTTSTSPTSPLASQLVMSLASIFSP